MDNVVVFSPVVPVFFLGNPEDLDPSDCVLDAYADPRVSFVVFSLAWCKILARLAHDGDPHIYSLYRVGHPTVRGVPVVPEVVAAGLVPCIPVPAGESGRERGVLHLVHHEVVVAARKVGRLVDDQPVEAGRVLDLDGVHFGLAREVRLLGLGLLRLLYGLLGGVNQGDHPREEFVQILDGGGLAGLLVELLRQGKDVPYNRGHLADVGGDRPPG